MKKSTIIIAIMALSAKPVYSGVYISDIGFGAECPLTGNDSVVAPQCSTWCKNRYGNTMYGTMVISQQCRTMGIESDYTYCCANNAALDIINKCKCADANQLTVADKTNGKSYRKSNNTDGTYSYTCEDLYCFCDISFYGSRQLMSQSISGACTKCPCDNNVVNTYGNSPLCGWTHNNFALLTDNEKAPSTNITNCKAGPISSGIPEQYRTYKDNSGTFVLSGPCQYVQ